MLKLTYNTITLCDLKRFRVKLHRKKHTREENRGMVKTIEYQNIRDEKQKPSCYVYFDPFLHPGDLAFRLLTTVCKIHFWFRAFVML